MRTGHPPEPKLEANAKPKLEAKTKAEVDSEVLCPMSTDCSGAGSLGATWARVSTNYRQVGPASKSSTSPSSSSSSSKKQFETSLIWKVCIFCVYY